MYCSKNCQDYNDVIRLNIKNDNDFVLLDQEFFYTQIEFNKKQWHQKVIRFHGNANNLKVICLK